VEPGQYIPAERASTAPQPTLAVTDFHDDIGSGRAFYVVADVDPGMGDWTALGPALERLFGLVTVQNDILIGDSGGGLDVRYSYEGLSTGGGGGTYTGRVIAVYEGSQAPGVAGSGAPTPSVLLLTIE
jgi:hypothetical protein